MMGDRDSEIALVIQDMQFEDGHMNERPYKRGVSAGALRMQLFREHLGLSDDDVSVADPTSERTWQRIRNVSQNNTKIFESVFDCAPSNKMRAFTSFQNIDVTQIYENQRINVLKVPGRRRHVWDKENLKDGDYAPWTDVNGVPIAEDRINLDDFVVDNFKDKRKKHLFSMDHDGWLYARNFSIFQEIRTMKTDYRKREKLQHLVADRLMAQVRRRRWVKKGLLPPRPDPRESSFSLASDDEEHGRFHSIWRRLQQGDFSRSNSISLTPTNFSNMDTGGGIAGSMSVGGTYQGRRLHNSSSMPSTNSILMGDSMPSLPVVLGDTPSYPNSPSVSSFQHTPQSPSVNVVGGPRSVRSARTSSLLGTGGGVRTRANTRSARGSFYGLFSVTHGTRHLDTDDESSDAGSDYGGGHGIRASLKRWYSTMDVLDFGRRSKFNAEYFDTGEDHLQGDDPLLEEGQGSYHESRDGLLVDETEASSAEDADCQISHVQTAATVRKEDETRARGQLSEIRGHLVEFPLDFLVEEILKPSVLPADIHI
jgi:hypothetical protein